MNSLVRTLALCVLFCTVGCAAAPKPKPEEVFILLSKQPQMCASPGKEYTNLTIFIHLLRMEPQAVLLDMDHFVQTTLYGSEVTLDIAQLGVGEHTLYVTAGSHAVTQSLSVWECGG